MSTAERYDMLHDDMVHMVHMMYIWYIRYLGTYV